MDNQQTKSILTVALMAAFADGLKDERERESVRKLAEVLGAEASIDLPAWYRDVLLSRPDLTEVVKPLDTQGLRQYAYEMAVGVVNSDGSQNAAEAAFLAQLAAALQLPTAAAESVAQQASAMADAAVEPTGPAPPAGAATAASAPTAVAGTVLGKANVSDAEMDKTIMSAAITNAALELLPESIASMAIIPLQLRLVYRIGKAYGYEMDMFAREGFHRHARRRPHVAVRRADSDANCWADCSAASAAVSVVRSASQAASSGLTFATTYAIGRVAQRYYAGGRTLDSATLKETFTSLLAEARGMAPKYQSQIEQAAQKIDTRKLV